MLQAVRANASRPACRSLARVLAQGYARRAVLLSRRYAPACTYLPNRSFAHLEWRRSFATESELGPEEDFETVGSKLIPIVNKLQEVFAMTGTDLELPQIVVVGGQSSGKSSVLENLVGRDFLPRGTGIVTRRPLILQLTRTEAGSKEYGEFSHLKKKFTDFSQIREEIQKETDRLAGDNKAISPEPIILRIYSPNVLPLTLVDTPGITRVPVGDQPQDIEMQIRDMVMQYINSKNAIVLAVQPANQDLATSDALKLAREVDPAGERTIGVLTKLDLMDAGTNALDVLNGKVLPLKLGFIGVVNRSQMDIVKNKPIVRSLKEEHNFFFQHPQYAALAHRCGSRYLGITCNKLLTKHIREVLPQLKKDIKAKLTVAETELMSLGEEPAGTASDQKWMLLQVLNKFCIDFKDVIEGSKAKITTSELHGGARVRYIFDEIFRKKLAEISPTQGLTVEEYRTAIRNAAGPRPALFIPEGAFELLAKRQIELLREPSMQCAELVMAELQRIAARLDQQDLGRFPILREQVIEVANSVLKKCLKPAKVMIRDLVDCELAYINTNHPDFIGGVHGSLLREGMDKHMDNSVELPKETESPGLFGRFFGGKKKEEPIVIEKGIPSDIRLNKELSDREKMQIGLIKKLLNSYFDISRKNLQDSVTKAIWHFLVRNAEEQLHKSLITQLYHEGDTEKLLRESELVKERRRILSTEVQALKKAKRVLQVSELPDEL